MSRADLLRLRTSRWRYLGLVILLGLYFAQSIAASAWHSVTFDEQYHLTPGYVYLTQRDLRFHHDQNPPLFEAILSAPLLARSDIQLPIDHPAYQLWSDVYLFSDRLQLGYRASHPLRAKYCEPDSCFILTPHPARYITADLPGFVKDTAVAVPSSAGTYQVYQLDATPAIQEILQRLPSAAGAVGVTYPITFENGLAFAGYEIRRPSEGMNPSEGFEVNTYWRVTGRLQPPVTIFVHLLDNDGLSWRRTIASARRRACWSRAI